MSPEHMVACMVSEPQMRNNEDADSHRIGDAVKSFERLRQLTQGIEDAKDHPSNELQGKILEFGLDYHALQYASSTRGADITALQELALTSDTARKMYGDEDQGEIVYEFATINGADKKACEKRILEVGSFDVCLKFAINIPGADVRALYAKAEGMGELMDQTTWYETMKQFDIILAYYNTNHPA